MELHFMGRRRRLRRCLRAAGLHLRGLQRRVEQDKAIGSSCNNAITEQEEKHTHFSRSCWSQEVYHFPSNFQIRLREKAAY